MCNFSGENVEEAFLETAKKIYQNIQDGRFVGVFVELELLSVVNCTVHYVGTKPPFFIKPRCTHTHSFNGPFSGTTRVSRYQKGKTNLDFSKARDSEWQWHQLGHMQSAPSSRQITMPAPHHSSFLQARCSCCHPTNSIKALKVIEPHCMDSTVRCSLLLLV